MTSETQIPVGTASPISLPALAVSQLKIGLTSFGGGTTALLFHEYVVRRGWLTEAEFFRGLAISQILPGTNVANLSIVIGKRIRGVLGAAIALLALLCGPFFAVIAFGMIYARLSGAPWLAAALDGITAAVIGMVAVIVVRGARATPGVAALGVAVVTALAIGVLQLPFLLVVLVMAPVSIGLAALSRRP